MKHEDSNIVDFCRLLGRVRKLFREAHIYAEKRSCFATVTTNVSHGEKDLIINCDRFLAVEVSFSLDGELRKVVDGRYSLGASVAIFFVQNQWRLEGEVGWSCQDTGWDPRDSFEATCDTADELESHLEPLVMKTLLVYREFITAHESQQGNTQ